MIESLLYLITSIPDLMQVVCIVSRFQTNPREPHVLAVKKIFKYLSGKLKWVYSILQKIM